VLDDNTPAFDSADADRVYRNYLVRCRCLGIDPVPREQAQDLMKEWSQVIAIRRSAPMTAH
jgi:hypothetical protein